MSKHNKANRNNYMMGGRLSPDDMARERMRQREVSGHSQSKEQVIGRMSTKSSAPATNRPRNEREESE